MPFDALRGERTPSRIRSARRWTLERGPSRSASTLMSYPHRTLPSVSPELLEHLTRTLRRNVACVKEANVS